MNATQTLAAASLVGAALLLSAPAASGQVSVDADARSTVGRTFFGPSGGSGVGSSASRRFGVPRLRSLRGDHLRERARSTVPINVNSLANGTANDPIPRRRRRPRPRAPHVLPTTIVQQVTNQITVVASPEAARPNRAVRSVDAVRDRAESRPAPAPPAAGRRAPATAPPPETPAPRRTGVSPVPLVEPLVAPPSDEELDPRNCVTIRITTPGGIEWRHEVALDALGASSVTGAASLLQEKLRRDQPLVVRSPGGGFTVPAALVESLIVGPCR